MQALIEQFLDHWLGQAWRKGKHFLKVQSLSLAVRMVNSIRALFILNYVLMILSFMWGMSFMATAAWLLHFGVPHHFSEVAPPLYFFAGTFLITSSLIFISSKESSWLRATGLDDHIESAWRDEQQQRSQVDPEMLQQMVQEAVQKAMQAESHKNKRPPNPNNKKAS